MPVLGRRARQACLLWGVRPREHDDWPCVGCRSDMAKKTRQRAASSAADPDGNAAFAIRLHKVATTA